MKITTNIRASKDYSKEYLSKIFAATAEEIIEIRLKHGYDSKDEITSIHFGKTDQRGIPCIELSYKNHGLVNQLHFFGSNNELIAFCQGILFTKRGY